MGNSKYWGRIGVFHHYMLLMSRLIPLWSKNTLCMISFLLNLIRCVCLLRMWSLFGENSVLSWEGWALCCWIEYDVNFRLRLKLQGSSPFPPSPENGTFPGGKLWDSWELHLGKWPGHRQHQEGQRLEDSRAGSHRLSQLGVGAGGTSIIKLVLCSYICAWYFTYIILHLHWCFLKGGISREWTRYSFEWLEQNSRSSVFNFEHFHFSILGCIIKCMSHISAELQSR